jgi:hypothetical protein
MRAREFLPEDATAGATSAGSVATVSQPLGGMISRTQMPKPAKYSNSAYKAPNRKKQHARG